MTTQRIKLEQDESVLVEVDGKTLSIMHRTDGANVPFVQLRGHGCDLSGEEPGLYYLADLPDESHSVREGDRYVLTAVVERGPLFHVNDGAVGTVVEATRDLVRLKMDEVVPGAEDWDNEVVWTTDDDVNYDALPTHEVAADPDARRAFLTDAEVLAGDALHGKGGIADGPWVEHVDRTYRAAFSLENGVLIETVEFIGAAPDWDSGGECDPRQGDDPSLQRRMTDMLTELPGALDTATGQGRR